MDARDYVQMRYEKRLRDGLECRSGSSQTIGSFEKFTKVVVWPISTMCCRMFSYSLLNHFVFL